MAPALVAFVKRMCKKYGLSGSYVANKDMYILHKSQRTVYAFYGDTFWSVPMRHREYEILPLMKIGLNNNLGEKYYMQTFRPKHGKKIC